MKRFLLLAVLLVCAVTALAADYKFEREIIYRSVDEYSAQMCRLDVASIEGAQDLPVVVWFHGGGLTGGKKEIPQQLLDGRCVVVGVGYRFSPKVSVSQIIDDAACAVAWVFANIERYGGSKSKIYLSGHSAGGYLVSMLGLDASRLNKYCYDANMLKGVIPFSGQAITHFEERRSRGIANTRPVIDSL